MTKNICSKSHKTKHPRRAILKAGALLGAAASTSALMGAPKVRAADMGRKFLFVIGATGGASIIDSFLPVLYDGSANHDELNTYAQSQVSQPSGSNFLCARPLENAVFGIHPNAYNHAFMNDHKDVSCLMTLEGTSVNHIVAQQRSLNGAGVNQGRTLIEAVAAEHGQGMLLPAVNMAYSGFARPGTDVTLPDFAREEIIGDALYFPIATDPTRGMFPQSRGLDRLGPLLKRARRVREDLDNKSHFARTFKDAPLLQDYLFARRTRVEAMREAGVLDKLNLLKESTRFPLSEYGLAESEEIDRILTSLPDVADDPFYAQAALAFLLVRHGLTAAVGISPSFSFLEAPGFTVFKNTPLAFDYSHSAHRATQQTMWGRVLKVASGLIDLLQNQPLDDDNPSGDTLFDHSLIYLATDFGRSKTRPLGTPLIDGEFSTGHHLNNGNLMLSPLLQGNRIFGGIDDNTCLTYGFDPVTGDPAPGTVMREGHMYSAICQALEVPFDGRINMSAMMR